jgi:hypothetical protein
MSAKATKEAKKLTLDPGDPEAGYVSPDLSLIDGIETLTEEEQDAHDERNALREEEVDAVAEHEDKVARARIEELEKSGQAKDEEPKQVAKTGSASSSPKSS